MKNLLFGLITIVLFSFTGNAQTLSESSKSALVNSQMVTIVNVTKTFYLKGQSYDDFIKSLLIPTPTVPTQDEFLRKVYGYVSSNTAECDIMKSDNSVLTRFASDISKSQSNQSTSVFTAKKKWWQILINAAINIGVEVATGGSIHPNVDLWPSNP